MAYSVYRRSQTVHTAESLANSLLRFPYELRVFGFHVECPNDFVGAVNHEDEADCTADVHVFQPVDHLASAVVNQQGVNDDEREAKLSRAEFQVTDFETIGRGKCQKRADFITGTDRQQD